MRNDLPLDKLMYSTPYIVEPPCVHWKDKNGHRQNSSPHTHTHRRTYKNDIFVKLGPTGDVKNVKLLLFTML